MSPAPPVAQRSGGGSSSTPPSAATTRPDSRIGARSALDRGDLELEGDLVADQDAAGLERGVPGDAPVLAVHDDAALEADPAVARVQDVRAGQGAEVGGGSGGGHGGFLRISGLSLTYQQQARQTNDDVSTSGAYDFFHERGDDDEAPVAGRPGAGGVARL